MDEVKRYISRITIETISVTTISIGAGTGHGDADAGRADKRPVGVLDTGADRPTPIVLPEGEKRAGE